jgi:hypothetical protein
MAETLKKGCGARGVPTVRGRSYLPSPTRTTDMVDAASSGDVGRETDVG